MRFFISLREKVIIKSKLSDENLTDSENLRSIEMKCRYASIPAITYSEKILRKKISRKRKGILPVAKTLNSQRVKKWCLPNSSQD